MTCSTTKTHKSIYILIQLLLIINIKKKKLNLKGHKLHDIK